MAFEKFPRARAAAMTKPAEVTVLSNGIVSFTWRAFELLGEPSHVEFHFDPDRRIVGLAPSGQTDDSYQVRKPATPGKVSVRGETFLKYYNIWPTAKYTAPAFEEDGLLCFVVPEGKGSASVDEPSERQQTVEPQQPQTGGWSG